MGHRLGARQTTAATPHARKAASYAPGSCARPAAAPAAAAAGSSGPPSSTGPCREAGQGRPRAFRVGDGDARRWISSALSETALSESVLSESVLSESALSRGGECARVAGGAPGRWRACPAPPPAHCARAPRPRPAPSPHIHAETQLLNAILRAHTGAKATGARTHTDKHTRANARAAARARSERGRPSELPVIPCAREHTRRRRVRVRARAGREAGRGGTDSASRYSS